jgi:Fe-S-cluster containining protein
MQLSLDDIQRLERLGYTSSEFVRIKDGFYTLKNRNGACFFFDTESSSCRVYVSRPDGCRFYPIIYSMDDGHPIIDGEECHRATTITEHELRTTTPKLARFIKRVLRDSPGKR